MLRYFETSQKNKTNDLRKTLQCRYFTQKEMQKLKKSYSLGTETTGQRRRIFVVVI